jgi:hypothetical protein
MGIEMQLKGSKKGISRTPLVQTKGKKIVREEDKQ